MESVLRKAGMHRNGTVFYKILAYADDFDILGLTMRNVITAFSAIERKSMKMDLADEIHAVDKWDRASRLRSRLTATISMLSRSLYSLAPPLIQPTTSAWKSSEE